MECAQSQEEFEMSDAHYAECCWNGSKYLASTPYGDVKMFEAGGQRAVELFLLSAAACLDFYLVEYAQQRGLELDLARVSCKGTVDKGPERVSRISVNVEVRGDLTERDRKKMVTLCERACKIMNTLKNPPQCELMDAEAGANTQQNVVKSSASATQEQPSSPSDRAGERRSQERSGKGKVGNLKGKAKVAPANDTKAKPSTRAKK